MSYLRRMPALLLCCAAGLLPCVGCHKADDGMSQEQNEKADRLSKIAQQSKGDWDKVPDADKEYVKSLTSGDENGAKMLLLGKAGKLHGAPGGAPPSH
jgi:hypothetical protein